MHTSVVPDSSNVNPKLVKIPSPIGMVASAMPTPVTVPSSDIETIKSFSDARPPYALDNVIKPNESEILN